MQNKLKLTVAAGALGLGMVPVAAQAEQFVSLGTAGVTGVYYPVGGAICRLVNRDRADHGIRCSTESTAGSVFNVRALRGQELEFGIITSDVQYDSLQGQNAFEDDGPFEGLRALFSLHAEPMQVMVRADAEIESVEDFVGKRVNIGNPGSGTRELANAVLEYAGIDVDDLALAGELRSAEQAAALCDGHLHASIWAAGLPNGSTEEATSTCDIKILPMEGEWVDELLADNPAFGPVTVPGGMYTGNPDDIPSWGPLATFVSAEHVPDEVVYTVVKAIMDNLESFRDLHPALQPLDPETMIASGLTAELHPGAVQYYEERGWK